MQIYKTLLLIGVMFSLLMASVGIGLSQTKHPEINESARIMAAEKTLNGNDNLVLMYAQGLCCPSCAIGVRKMVSKLAFVDQSRFNKGVQLDTKTQLIAVAIAEGQTINLDALSQAVWSAGYTPVRVYKLLGGHVTSEPLAPEKS